MGTRNANGGRTSGIAPGLAVAASALVTLGVVASISYWLGRRTEPALRFLEPRRPPTVDEAAIAHPIEYALGSREANDVVFLGDSTCFTGIDPLKLSGLRAYNLGSQGSLGPVGTLITAKAYFENHPPPRAFVVCFSPFRFEASTGYAGGILPGRFVASYGPEVKGVVPLQKSVDHFLKRGAVGMLAEAQRDVREDSLDGLSSETYWSLQRRTHERRGFFALPGTHGGRWIVEQPPPPQLILGEWDDAIRGLARLCDESGVTLLILFSPIWDELSHARDFSQLDRWARELEATSRRVRAARPIVRFYPRSLMWDAIHLNAAGVEKNMPVVAKAVEAVLSK
jgi:hypothetical protein